MTSWGVLLPTFDPLRRGETFPVAEAARLAEQAGYASIWAGDHLKCPAPVLDAPTCLAVAATVPRRPQIGFSVMLLGMRPLAWAAKQIATLQHLSDNRLRLGVGVGGEFPQEYEAAEVPHNRRGARLDEALEAAAAVSWGRGPSIRSNRRRRCRPCSSVGAATALWSGPRSSATHGCRCGCRQRRSPSGASGWQSSPHNTAGRHRASRCWCLRTSTTIRPAPASRRMRTCAASTGWRSSASSAGPRSEAPEQVAEFLEPYTQVGVSEILLLPLGARAAGADRATGRCRSRIASLSDAA